MTEDTGDFRQVHTVACREYNLPRDDGSSQPAGWIQGNSKIEPVLEITTRYLYGKDGIEIRNWFLRNDKILILGSEFLRCTCTFSFDRMLVTCAS